MLLLNAKLIIGDLLLENSLLTQNPQTTLREKTQLLFFYYKVNNLRIFLLTALKPSFICPWVELEAARSACQQLFCLVIPRAAKHLTVLMPGQDTPL